MIYRFLVGSDVEIVYQHYVEFAASAQKSGSFVDQFGFCVSENSVKRFPAYP